MVDTAWDLWTDEVFETGLRATLIAGCGMLFAAAVPGWSGHGWPFALAVLLAASPAALLAPSRARRRLHERLGGALPVLWSVIIVVAVSVGVVIAGDPTGPVVAAYVLPVVYFSTLYPGRVQLLLLFLLTASYTFVLGLLAQPAEPGSLLVLLTVIGTTAFLASQLARQLRSHHDREREARALAVRRAELIRLVVDAGDEGQLDPDRIIEDLLEAARDLGMECVALFSVDHDLGACTVTHSRGFTADEVGVPRPLDDGLVGVAARNGEAVVVERADELAAALPCTRARGLASALAVPVRIGGEVVGVLNAATRHREMVTSELREAFELLAIRAANALARARQHSEQAEALDRMRELDRMKNDFVATASHELRTPVTVVKAASELLVRHWEQLPEDRRHDLLERLASHVDRLDGVVDSLTRFRTLQVGGYEPALRAVSLKDQLLAVVDRVHQDEGAAITWHLDREHVVVTDPRLFKGVLRELVENAVRHAWTSRGVALSAHARDDHVTVIVRDHGPGLPPNVAADLRAAFRRGGSTDRSRSGGLGLGLATAMTALELLGVHSEVDGGGDGGTRWTLHLPRATSRVIDLGQEAGINPARDRSRG